VAVAICPDLVKTHIEKWCHVESKGERTRGMLTINWDERYAEHERAKTNIVTSVNGEALI
jgi:hypothetical protein